jgi:hypothetical protein
MAFGAQLCAGVTIGNEEGICFQQPFCGRRSVPFAFMRLLILFVFLVSCLQSQSSAPGSVSAGFIVGSPLNEPPGANSLFSSFTQDRWTGGPTIDLSLSRGFVVEFDALYRNYRERRSFPLHLGQNTNPYAYAGVRKTDAWDLPLLLKYRFRIGPASPFVSAGHFWTHESRESSYGYSCTGPEGSCKPEGYPVDLAAAGFSRSSAFHRGIVGGVGIEFRAGRISIAPELRFSRPTHGAVHDNRFTALVGFTFGKK